MFVPRKNPAKSEMCDPIQLRAQLSAVNFFRVSVTRATAGVLKLTLLELSPVSGCVSGCQT